MPLILCIETATHLCSVALGRDGRVLATRDVEERGRFIHAERLNMLVDEAMKETGLTLRDLDAVAVGIGPGSYTGLRIGLSAAKGFCYALEIPIIGIGTLGTLVSALQVSGFRSPVDAVLQPMIDARRMEVFTQQRSADPASTGGHALNGPQAVVLDEGWLAGTKDPLIVFGDGADKAVELWKSNEPVGHVAGIKPWAKAMVPIAEERFASRQFDDLAYLVPMYGKAPNVTGSSRGS